MPDTIEQMKDKVHQVQKLGFKKDGYISPKGSDELQIWKIVSITMDGVECIRMEVGEETSKQHITLGEMLKKWRIHKGKVTAKLAGWSYDNCLCSPLSSKLWQMEVARGAVAMALRAEYQRHESVIKELCLLQNPSGVKVNKAFKVGELSLVAATQRIERKQGTSGLAVGRFCIGDATDAILYVTPHFVPPLDGKAVPNKTPWVAPFWLVNTSEDDDFNMDLVFAKKVIEECTVYVPILRNEVALSLEERFQE